MQVKIHDFANCTVLYICKGFLKISITNCNNNNLTYGDKCKFPDSGWEFAESSDRMGWMQLDQQLGDLISNPNLPNDNALVLVLFKA